VKLVIGKFCAIASEMRFIMTGDRKFDGFSDFHLFPISVVAGNPGKVVKRRFDEKTIERFLEIARWD
jgi:hypothetical protein